MPRDGYLSPAALARLEGYCAGFSAAGKFHGRFSIEAEQLKSLFYASLFQAGLDRVAVLKQYSMPSSLKGVPHKRLVTLSFPQMMDVISALERHFQEYLGEGWIEKEEYSEAWRFTVFLSDLLVGMRLARPILGTSGIPDVAQLRVSLPPELFIPIDRFMKSIKNYEPIVAVPSFAIKREQLDVLEEILASDDYKTVEGLHVQLPQTSSKRRLLADLRKASTALYWRWTDFLRLKSTMVRVIVGLPDIIEQFSGKVASSAAKPVATFVSERLAQDHPIIVYDGASVLDDVMDSVMRQRALIDDKLNRRLSDSP